MSAPAVLTHFLGCRQHCPGAVQATCPGGQSGQPGARPLPPLKIPWKSSSGLASAPWGSSRPTTGPSRRAEHSVLRRRYWSPGPGASGGRLVPAREALAPPGPPPLPRPAPGAPRGTSRSLPEGGTKVHIWLKLGLQQAAPKRLATGARLRKTKTESSRTERSKERDGEGAVSCRKATLVREASPTSAALVNKTWRRQPLSASPRTTPWAQVQSGRGSRVRGCVGVGSVAP